MYQELHQNMLLLSDSRLYHFIHVIIRRSVFPTVMSSKPGQSKTKNSIEGPSGSSDKILVLATGNPDKVKELNELLEGKGLEVQSLKELAGDVDIEETGSSLDENAEIKARFAWEKTGLPALADDTGLEVDALAGRPGVHSARYAGPAADALQNRRKLLDELRHITDPAARAARFRTVLVYIGPAQSGLAQASDTPGSPATAHQPPTGGSPEIRIFEGICEGRIITAERGSTGFGYDPLFLPDGYDETFAEMDTAEKNRISHRGRALRKFLADMP